jgi:hypothetical protein
MNICSFTNEDLFRSINRVRASIEKLGTNIRFYDTQYSTYILH